MRTWIMIVAALACLYGGAGVALSAAGAHLAGAGAMATTAGHFLLVHAAALIGLTSAAIQVRRPGLVLAAASLIALGTLLFSGHLALHALWGVVPIAFAAPFGGSLTILGWLVAAAVLPLAIGGRSASAPRTD